MSRSRYVLSLCLLYVSAGAIVAGMIGFVGGAIGVVGTDPFIGALTMLCGAGAFYTVAKG